VGERRDFKFGGQIGSDGRF